MKNALQDEFDRLLSRHFDGELAADESRRLSELIAGDADRAREFSRTAALHCQMRSVLKYDRAVSPPVVFSEETGFDGQKIPTRWPWFAGGALFACCVGLIAFLAWKPAGNEQLARVSPAVPSKVEAVSSAPSAVAAGSPAVTPAVAYLTVANGCNWGTSQLNAMAVGHRIQSGEELTLHEGIAEFNLSSGVTLSIEGPAALVLNSPRSLVVHFGKITVYVPWTVSDFKMLASSCPISACDAGFGVNVLGSTVDLHVFSGEVIVGSSPFGSLAANEWEYGSENIPVQREAELPGGSEFIKALVPKGRAMQMSDSSGAMKVARWHAAKATEFAAKLSMAGSLPVTDTYVMAVMKSKPVGYWRFESQEEARVVNQVSPSNDLLIVGDVKLIGGEENRVAEFGRTRSEGHMVSTKPLDALAGSDYSVELWMKPSHSHRGGLLGLAVNQHRRPDQVGPTNFHGFFLEIVGALKPAALVELGLKEPNSIRFLHRDPPGSEYRMGTSCFSGAPYVVRRWQHVVAVKSGAEMRLYLNGKLAGRRSDASGLSKGLFLEVGQLIGTHEVVPFVGQLDELAVYNRALMRTEIKRHYQAIDWTQKRKSPAPKAEAKAANNDA